MAWETTRPVDIRSDVMVGVGIFPRVFLKGQAYDRVFYEAF